MIRVTRLNGEQFALNPDLIERVEAHPDTVVFLVEGTRYVVTESVDTVMRDIREYRAGIIATSYEMDRGEYRPAAAPEVGVSSPTIARIVVDFPAPFGPRKPVTVPGRATKVRSSTAVVAPFASGP